MPETNNEEHVAAKNDEQEIGWDGRNQWDKLWGTTEKVELVRTCTAERGGERLFYSIGVDSRKTKTERETKDHFEKNCSEREKQGRVEELECSQARGAGQRLLVWECVGLMRLLARGDLMMRIEPGTGHCLLVSPWDGGEAEDFRLKTVKIRWSPLQMLFF